MEFTIKVTRYTSTLYLLWKQNKIIVPDEIDENYPGKNTVKTLSFRTDHIDKPCKLRSACSFGIGVIRVYKVAIPDAHCVEPQ